MTTISISRFKDLFGCSKGTTQPELTEFSESFKPIERVNPKYVAPFFLKQYGADIPQVVLVTAAGAVGKSELTAYMSREMKLPVLDLAIHPPVGDSTLTGVISKAFDSKKEVKSALENGRYGIIIDALDEGALKVRHDAFLSFLDDVALWVDPAQTSASICLLGRTNVMEETALYLEEKGIRVILVQIEPFTIDQARKFLYNQVIGDKKNKFGDAFKKVSDFILESIDGFFKNQGESVRSSYRNFIGYAPVLLAIAKLMNDEPDFNALYNRLQQQNVEKVRLLVHLTRDILERERRKVVDNLATSLFSDYDRNVKQIAEANCYCEKEQVIRLCGKIMGFEPKICPTGIPAFDEQYERLLRDFLAEHPFLADNRIINVVFESYLIGMMASYGSEYTSQLERYVKNDFKNSFAFFPVITTVYEQLEMPIPHYLFGAVYSSLTDQTVKASETEIDIYQSETDSAIAEISLENDGEELSCELRMRLGDDGVLDLGSRLSNATVYGEFDVALTGRKVTFTGPVSIVCDVLHSTCGELLILGSPEGREDTVALNCRAIEAGCSETGSLTKITVNGRFRVLSEEKPEYPFVAFYEGLARFKRDADQQKYLKLVNIISQFRGHKKKGDWGKSKDKIDRRFEQGVGLEVKKALIDSGIIYPDAHLYKLNQTKMREILNLSYSDMLEGRSNDKVNEFILTI